LAIVAIKGLGHAQEHELMWKEGYRVVAFLQQDLRLLDSKFLLHTQYSNSEPMSDDLIAKHFLSKLQLPLMTHFTPWAQLAALMAERIPRGENIKTGIATKPSFSMRDLADLTTFVSGLFQSNPASFYSDPDLIFKIVRHWLGAKDRLPDDLRGLEHGDWSVKDHLKMPGFVRLDPQWNTPQAATSAWLAAKLRVTDSRAVATAWKRESIAALVFFSVVFCSLLVGAATGNIFVSPAPFLFPLTVETLTISALLSGAATLIAFAGIHWNGVYKNQNASERGSPDWKLFPFQTNQERAIALTKLFFIGIFFHGFFIAAVLAAINSPQVSTFLLIPLSIGWMFGSHWGFNKLAERYGWGAATASNGTKQRDPGVVVVHNFPILRGHEKWGGNNVYFSEEFADNLAVAGNRTEKIRLLVDTARKRILEGNLKTPVHGSDGKVYPEKSSSFRLYYY